MTLSSLTFPPNSLRLSPTSKFTIFSSPNYAFTQHPCPLPITRPVSMCVPTQHRNNPGPKKTHKKNSSSSEAEELVRSVLRNFREKKPLVTTLDKYAKFLRTEHCFMLFEELGKDDKWLQCLEVFRWMQKQRWYIADNGVYSKLISVMGKKGQTRMAMWLFSEMRNSGCRPDTSVYNALISAHLHSRDKSKALSKALGYFDKMKDIFTFNGVMDAYGKNGMIREMESVLSMMKSNQLKPDIITFNLLIDSYGRKQEFEKMEQVFKSLLRSKHKPTLPTFNSMITNYGKARLREKAELAFQKMTDMGYKPNFITYECLIMMYGYCDYVSRAREIFQQVVESEEKKVSTLNAMLDVYCMNGLPMEADMLFESAHTSRLFPIDSSTYKLLYKAYTKADMKELLQKLLTCMDRDGIIPNKRFFLDALGAIGSSRANQKSTRKTDGSNRQTDSAKT
ncbi:pentatricopeptide repeat-containing At4g39620, chloroplastic [Olea europaea subsp. europaea]|uniref:Pentatricopeptide repeat-containing At4g39620, chloroplastic n=1 Tax=Olea europaea subsp. europaea TaxID=158383 RepID=A0A8S0SPW8_OLEEU|nr:pentatricopeptide repeat-containing At4g39620, chloroplastic [Olea europaea subsp. europaea]